MANDPLERAGWQTLFQSGNFPPRYKASAAPNDAVVEWANSLATNSHILDVGCGVGRHVLYLAGRGFKMAGSDISPLGVQMTAQACAERQLEFDGRVADMAALPWDDATFDAALSTATVSHNRRTDIIKTLNEIRRILKPGGVFLVDFPHKETQAYQNIREQTAQGQLTEVEPDTFVDNSAEPDMNDDAFLPHYYSDEADLRDLLQSFEIIKLWADLPGRPPDGGLVPRGWWVAWVRKPL